MGKRQAKAAPKATKPDPEAHQGIGDLPDQTPTTSAETLRSDIMFSALNSATYHSMREMFFARAYRIAAGIQALFATAAFAAIVKILPGICAAWLALIVAVSAIFTLIWDPAGMAMRHNNLRRRFYEIYARAEAASSIKKLEAIRHKMRLIYADEPPAYNAIKAMAWNTAISATYPPEVARKYLVPVSVGKRILANFWPFRSWDMQDA